jgi:adenosine deaminase CECR1
MEDAMEKLRLEEDEFDKTEGLPSIADPFMQKYLEGRDALVAQEKKQRSGW